MKNLLNSNLILFASVFLLCISSCKKDDDTKKLPTEEQKEAKIQLLAGDDGKAWILKSIVAGVVDGTQYLPACNRDDIYFIHPDGDGELRGGELKCKEDEADVLETGSWELSDNLEILTVNFGFLKGDCKILELSENELKLQFTYENQVAVATLEKVE